MKSDLRNVIENKYCCGCGACIFILSDKATIKLDSNGLYRPIIDFENESNLNIASKVCPFSNLSDNEDLLGKEVFSDIKFSHSKLLGYYFKTYSGYSKNDRKHGASGGIITWLLKTLLKTKEVDYVITVSQTKSHHPRFEYIITNEINEVENSGGSAYYPISYSDIIDKIKKLEGSFAFVGIPCFNKSLRLLRKNDKEIDRKIKYQFGVVCGHLKTKSYVDFLIRNCGQNEKDIVSVNFRRKIPKLKINEYYFEAINKKGDISRINNRNIGINWGMGAFKPKFCDYCDDVFAETSDFVCMDAWLPKYLNFSDGISLFITRNEKLDELINKGTRELKLETSIVDSHELVQSQSAGIRHKRKGLKYRLSISKGWVPVKRVNSNRKMNFWFKLVQKERIFLRNYSIFIFKIQQYIPGIWLFNFLMFPMKRIFRLTNKMNRLFGSQESLSV